VTGPRIVAWKYSLLATVGYATSIIVAIICARGAVVVYRHKEPDLTAALCMAGSTIAIWPGQVRGTGTGGALGPFPASMRVKPAWRLSSWPPGRQSTPGPGAWPKPRWPGGRLSQTPDPPLARGRLRELGSQVAGPTRRRSGGPPAALGSAAGGPAPDEGRHPAVQGRA
jgi:hypothetical protein